MAIMNINKQTLMKNITFVYLSLDSILRSLALNCCWVIFGTVGELKFGISSSFFVLGIIQFPPLGNLPTPITSQVFGSSS